MRPGELRYSVDVQAPTESTSGRGGVTRSYDTEGTRRAKIEYGPSDEATFGEQVEREQDVTITMRYYDGITGDYQIVHDGTTYELVGRPQHVNSRGGMGKTYTVCACKQVT